jgi:hypothetical protein
VLKSSYGLFYHKGASLRREKSEGHGGLIELGGFVPFVNSLGNSLCVKIIVWSFYHKGASLSKEKRQGHGGLIEGGFVPFVDSLGNSLCVKIIVWSFLPQRRFAAQRGETRARRID